MLVGFDNTNYSVISSHKLFSSSTFLDHTSHYTRVYIARLDYDFIIFTIDVHVSRQIILTIVML